MIPSYTWRGNSLRFASAGTKLTDVLRESGAKEGNDYSCVYGEREASPVLSAVSSPPSTSAKKDGSLWLKSQGLAHQKITKLVGISANTLRSYTLDGNNLSFTKSLKP